MAAFDTDKQAGLSKPTPEAPNPDRELWLAVRRALLAIVAAIGRLGGRSKDSELWRAVRHALMTIVTAIEQQWGTGKDSNHHG